jgi:enediyne biosynthesis protein E4
MSAPACSRVRDRRRPPALLALAGQLLLAACGGEDAGPADTATAVGTAHPARAIRFEEVTAELGIDFVHRTGSEGSYPMPAIMGGGLAVFDYDGDDRLDLYFVQAGDRFAPGGGPSGIGNQLFRQEADGRFTEVGAQAGVADRGYGMGAAVGDIDNDGDLDLFVTNYGPDVLYRNDGDGTFTDVTRAAGVGDPGWSASAVFLDYDRDGLLDLYVTRYVALDPERECALEGGRLDYCGPAQFPGVRDLLYHNEGGGRFREVGREAGIANTALRGLGVVAADLDDDGWIDLYVANDSDPNNLWLNQGDGTFVDDAVLLGVAYNREGVGEAGMGLGLGDADGDGDPDLFVTHLIEETNTYYENLGEAGFEDRTATAGLGVPSVGYTGFGTALADLDLDGDPDIPVVNGGVKHRPSALAGRPGWFWDDYAEPNLLFVNLGDGRFEPAASGAFGEPVEVSRGLFPADLDRDGDLDLVVTNVEGPARVYRNPTLPGEAGPSWLELRLVDPALRRETPGAEVTVRAGDRRWVRDALPAGSYLAGGHPRVHLGLGAAAEVDAIEVRWPDGLVERFPGGAVDRVIELRRGEGEPR